MRSDYARNLAREGTDLATLTGELVDGALADAALDLADIEVIHVGNAFGELFARQAQMGALPATARPGLWGIPASRHEAACASGSAAILGAMADLEAGRYAPKNPGADQGPPSGKNGVVDAEFDDAHP